MSRDARKEQQGESLLYGGIRDPRTSPGVSAERGAIYIQSGTGAIKVFQKQDAGKTTNWLEIAAASAMAWAASIQLDFDSPAASDIYTVKAGERIVGVKVFVEVAFDGGALVSVGDDQGNVDNMMLTGENNLPGINTYESNPLVSLNAGEKVQAHYTAGAATVGRAIVAVQKLIITGAVV